MVRSDKPFWLRISLSDSKPKWDLARHVALGCLVFDQYFDDVSIYSSELQWKELEVRVLNPESPFVQAVGPHLLALIAAGWIRVFAQGSLAHRKTILRIHVLPHDFRRAIVNRTSKDLLSYFKRLLSNHEKPIDTSSATWNADYDQLNHTQPFDPWSKGEDHSLHYLFNTLRSPEPDIEKIESPYSRMAMSALLDAPLPLRGFRSTLYPFQAKSAASMLQRECQPERHLDPTLEERLDAKNERYFYCPRFCEFFREERYYESNRGGILAESMGLGKTVICLALIVATKGHMPSAPPEYPLRFSKTREMRSLREICVNTIVKHSLPWKAHFEILEEESGVEMLSVKNSLKKITPFYEIPICKPRSSRHSRALPPIRKTLCSGTIIVVPPNLMKQWKTEIEKHVKHDVLNVFVMEHSNQLLPSATRLAEYDVLLITKYLFERENADGQDRLGRRFVDGTQSVCQCPYIGSTRQRDCTCLTTDDIYVSPLRELHWLRIIVDEGHSFSTKNTRAASVMDKLITAERRWVVSGTPAKDLVGVEVDLSNSEVSRSVGNASIEHLYDIAAQQRKYYNRNEDTAGAASALGNLATYFLKVRPWAIIRSDTEGLVNWDEHIYRHEDWVTKTYTSFSKCLKQVLESLIIKTRIEDVERDLKLPPLERRVIRLEPSYMDKLSANLFTQVLRANAVTSERTDQDYLFHPKGVKARTELIKNLRHSTFAWTGFQEDDIQKSVEVCRKYLEDHQMTCSTEDHESLYESTEMALVALNSLSWLALSQSHEIGIFVDEWPHASAEHWMLDKSSVATKAEGPTLMMTGPRLLIAAQKHIDNHPESLNPLEGFTAAGIRTRISVLNQWKSENRKSRETEADVAKLERTGVPASCTTGERQTKPTSLAGERVSPKAKKRKRSDSGETPRRTAIKLEIEDDGGPDRSSWTPSLTSTEPNNQTASVQKKASFSHEERMSNDTLTNTDPKTPKSILKKANVAEQAIDQNITLDPSVLSRSMITGTSSAKLSYILNEVVAHEADEKIIIFFDSNNHAWYISECLELLNIPHLIYMRGLKSDMRAAYIDSFNNNPRVRVLLMDLIFGAHGLNLNAASRVLFVNPVCRPDIEAQAVKRAHRIGQKKRVVVETLILRGTVEEAMLERAEKMTRGEHKQAKLLEDDEGIKSIIQNARILPISEEERDGRERQIPLSVPQQIFGRPDRERGKRIEGIDKEEGEPRSKRARNSKAPPSSTSKSATPDTQHSAANGSPPPVSRGFVVRFATTTATAAAAADDPAIANADAAALTGVQQQSLFGSG